MAGYKSVKSELHALLFYGLFAVFASHLAADRGRAKEREGTALRCQCRPRSGQETAKPDAQLASVVIQTTITACLQMNVQTDGPQFDGQATERDRQTGRETKKDREREEERGS